MALTDEERKERKIKSRRKWYESNRDHVRAYNKSRMDINRSHMRKFYIRHKARVSEDKKNYRASHLDRCHYLRKEIRDKLGDSYIKDKLTRGSSLRSEDIPQELVELKRQQMILTRTIREIQKC